MHVNFHKKARDKMCDFCNTLSCQKWAKSKKRASRIFNKRAAQKKVNLRFQVRCLSKAPLQFYKALLKWPLFLKFFCDKPSEFKLASKRKYDSISFLFHAIVSCLFLALNKIYYRHYRVYTYIWARQYVNEKKIRFKFTNFDCDMI